MKCRGRKEYDKQSFSNCWTFFFFLQCIQLSELIRLSHITPGCWKDLAEKGIPVVACGAEFGNCRERMVVWCYHLLDSWIAASVLIIFVICGNLAYGWESILEKAFFFFFSGRNHFGQLVNKQINNCSPKHRMFQHLHIPEASRNYFGVNRGGALGVRNRFYFSKSVFPNISSLTS